MRGEPEQQVMDLNTHTKEVGFIHHIWDEVGPELITGVCIIIAAVIGIHYKIHHKFKIPKGHWRGNRKPK